MNTDGMKELNLDNLEGITGGVDLSDPKYNMLGKDKDMTYESMVAQINSGVDDWRKAAENILGMLNIQQFQLDAFNVLMHEMYDQIMNGMH